MQHKKTVEELFEEKKTALYIEGKYEEADRLRDLFDEIIACTPTSRELEKDIYKNGYDDGYAEAKDDAIDAIRWKL